MNVFVKYNFIFQKNQRCSEKTGIALFANFFTIWLNRKQLLLHLICYAILFWWKYKKKKSGLADMALENKE